MTLRRLVAGVVALVWILVPLGGGTARAEAPSQDRSGTPIALANPQISVELLNALPESILDNGSIWVDPDMSAETAFLIVEPDGSLAVTEGQNPQQEVAAEEALATPVANCRTAAVVPLKSTLQRTSDCPAIIGTSPSTTITYSVQKNPSSSGFVSWVPWAFTKKWVNVAQPPLAPHYMWVYTGGWHSVGGANNMSVKVPWGAVAAYTKVKFTNGGTIGWSGSFTP